MFGRRTPAEWELMRGNGAILANTSPSDVSRPTRTIVDQLGSPIPPRLRYAVLEHALATGDFDFARELFAARSDAPAHYRNAFEHQYGLFAAIFDRDPLPARRYLASAPLEIFGDVALLEAV